MMGDCYVTVEDMHSPTCFDKCYCNGDTTVTWRYNQYNIRLPRRPWPLPRPWRNDRTTLQKFHYDHNDYDYYFSLQCIDAIRWATGRASGL